MDEGTKAILQLARRTRRLVERERLLTKQAMEYLEASIQELKDLIERIKQEDADAATVPHLDKNKETL